MFGVQIVITLYITEDYNEVIPVKLPGYVCIDIFIGLPLLIEIHGL